mgnify:CR=1 FL=1
MVDKYMDPGIAGRAWDAALNMMARRAKRPSSSWATGRSARSTPPALKYGVDYACAASAPADWGKPGFILNSDSVVFFQQSDPDYLAGQKLLAHLITVAGLPGDLQPGQGLDPGASRRRPVRRGLEPLPAACRRRTCRHSIAAGTLVRSMAHNMTVLQKYRGAMMEGDHRVREHPDMKPEDAANADG